VNDAYSVNYIRITSCGHSFEKHIGEFSNIQLGICLDIALDINNREEFYNHVKDTLESKETVNHDSSSAA